MFPASPGDAEPKSVRQRFGGASSAELSTQINQCLPANSRTDSSKYTQYKKMNRLFPPRPYLPISHLFIYRVLKSKSLNRIKPLPLVGLFPSLLYILQLGDFCQWTNQNVMQHSVSKHQTGLSPFVFQVPQRDKARKVLALKNAYETFLPQ